MNEKALSLLTVKEAAQRLTVSKYTVYRLIKSGNLKAVRISADRKGHRYRIREEEVIRFLSRYES